MTDLVFSQPAVYQLQQLAKAVRQKTGVRHRLSDKTSIISLLKYSSTSADPGIFTYFSRFTNELEEEQRNYLLSHGLIIPTVLYNKVSEAMQPRRAV